ncbi:MAG: MalY/PatB family protein [Acidimicrobiales bacterium]
MSTSNEIILPPIDHLRSLSGVKWSRFGPDVMPAWVADMDVRPPDCVTERIADIVQNGDFGYNRRASELLPETFEAWQLEHHGWKLDPGRVRTFCDVLHGLDVVLWLHTEPGDGVVLLTPIYPPFLKALDNAGRRLVDVPLDPDGWRLDADRLRAAIDDRTRVILICNPHNPTGRVLDSGELEAIAEVAIEHDLLVISDEVWADLVHPGASHVPLATIGDEIAARTVTLSSASKAFNLAGLRCALAHVGHDGVAEKLDALPAHLLGAVSTPGAEAAIAAWTSGAGWLESLREHLLGRRDQLAARLAKDLPDIGFQLPQATYLAWLDFREFGLGDDPSEWLRDEAGVAISPGPDFGERGLGFGRLNYATSAPILDELVDRLAAKLG